MGWVVACMIGCVAPPGAESEGESEGESESEEESESTAESGDGDDPCAAMCEVQSACDPDPHYSHADCLDACADEFEAAPAAEGCLPALTDFYACIGELTCEQFDVLFDDEQGPCYDEAVAFDDLCADALYCGLWFGGDEQGSYCTFEYECYASGVHRIECTDETCTCLLADVEVGSCDAVEGGMCDPLADPNNPSSTNPEILARMNACCGWALEI